MPGYYHKGQVVTYSPDHSPLKAASVFLHIFLFANFRSVVRPMPMKECYILLAFWVFFFCFLRWGFFTYHMSWRLPFEFSFTFYLFSIHIITKLLVHDTSH